MVAAVTAAYLPTLRNGFVNWDDDRYVVGNEALRSPAGLLKIWSTLEMPDGFPNYPLVLTSYWIEYQAWGASPAGYHATSTGLHAANVGLVFALALMLGASPWVACTAAAMFGLHPMQAESVVWVAERKNLLSSFFALITMLAYLQYRREGRWPWYAAALLSFVLALLSKTAVAPLPLSLLWLDLGRDDGRRRASLARLLPFLVFGGVAGLQTLHVEELPATVALGARPLLAAAALCFYGGMLLVPWNVMALYPRWEVVPGAVVWWLPLLGVLGISAIVYRWVSDRRIRWGLIHFVLLLLPVLGLRPFAFNKYSFVANHHVYLASVGFFLAFAEVLGFWHARRGRLVSLLTGLVVLCWLAITEQQILTWHDSESLWTQVLTENPRSPVALVNLGHELIDRGLLEEGAALFRQALEVAPDSAEAHTNLARVFFVQGKFEEAVKHCRAAVLVRPSDAGFHRNLAMALKSEGSVEEAKAELRAALRLRNDAGYHALLGDLLLAEGNTTEAIGEYGLALAIDDAPQVRHALGMAYLSADRLREAAAAFEDVVRRRPDWVEAHYNLAVALRALGNRQEAIQQLEEALRLAPQFLLAQQELESIGAESQFDGQ